MTDDAPRVQATEAEVDGLAAQLEAHFAAGRRGGGGVSRAPAAAAPAPAADAEAEAEQLRALLARLAAALAEQAELTRAAGLQVRPARAVLPVALPG